MVFASIDIGSNAVRLLFSNIFENEEGRIDYSQAAFLRIPIRLGEDVFDTGVIGEEKIYKLTKTIQAFKLLMDVNEPEAYDACATSAMRDAQNGQAIVAHLAKETGIRVRIISGQEEAQIIRSAGETYDELPHSTTMYIDVGGGSTEISVIQDHQLLNACSIEIGTLRLLQNKVDPKEWHQLDEWLMQFKPYFGKFNCIGSGGNINKITKLYGNKYTNSLHLKKLKEALKYLSGMSVQERVEKVGLRPDRADVIVPAAEIFCHIMSFVECKTVVSPKFGLVDGLIYQLFQEQKSMDK